NGKGGNGGGGRGGKGDTEREPLPPLKKGAGACVARFRWIQLRRGICFSLSLGLFTETLRIAGRFFFWGGAAIWL
ncbi:hypothetical protein AB4084_33975, partial [Lysobacter sp. 2RAB21]